MYRIATSASPALVNPSDWSHSFNDFLGYALEIDVCGPRRCRVLRSTSAFLPPSCWTILFVAWRAQRRSSASSLLWQSKSSRTTGSDCIHWISCGYIIVGLFVIVIVVCYYYSLIWSFTVLLPSLYCMIGIVIISSVFLLFGEVHICAFPFSVSFKLCVLCQYLSSE